MKESGIVRADNKARNDIGEGDSCCRSSSCRDTAIPLQFAGKESQLIDLKHKPGWVLDTIKTPAGSFFRVETGLSWSDRRGGIKSRISAFRMKYSVPPGLYAVGSPDKDSGVFVSANYKLSFDKLRNSLKEMNAWILVLDTKGINVWCAAGKGTFGTEELVNRISQTQLDKVVEHRRLIVPQLGAVGVNAKNVRERTGFRVYFGPVYAKDIPEYVNSGYKKSKGMRIIRFTLWDRMALTPMEINPAMKKYYPWYALAVLLIFGAQPSGILFKDAFAGGFPFLVLGLVSVIAGAFLTPALLPFIPFRSFAVKGWIVGIVSIYLSMNYFAIVPVDGLILQLVSYLFFPLLASYIALQFTGSTTFTGMSGVNKELRIGLPVYIAGAGTSVILSIIYKLGLWGVL